MDSLDTSFLDALGLDMTDGSLDLMIGEPFSGKVEKPQPPSTDDRLADGLADPDSAQLMEMIDCLDPPALSACTAMDGGAPSDMRLQQPAAPSSSAAACSPLPDVQPTAPPGKDFTRTSRNDLFLQDEEVGIDQHQKQPQKQRQQHGVAVLNPAGSALLSMASSDGTTAAEAAQPSLLRRANSAAYPGSYSPSRLSVGSSSRFVRHSAVEIRRHPALAALAPPLRHTASAHDLTARAAASLPIAVARSSDGFGSDDAAANAGATGSVSDLSMMLLDSAHEAHCATLAYSTGDAAPSASKTSTSSESGTLFKSASVPLPVDQERRHSTGNGVHKDKDSMRHRCMRRASHIAQVALSESAQHATDLAGQVQAILAANAGLKSRTQLLETFMGLLEAGRDPEQKEAWWLDKVTEQMVEQQLNLGPALTFTLRAGHPIVLTRAQVASVPWDDFCKLWKDYMVVLAECLVQAAGDVASPPGQRLAHLVYETGILRGCLQLDAPAHHNRLLCFLPDGEMRPPPPSAARWATICTSLLLTQTQKKQLFQLRRMYLHALGRSMGRRRAALQHISGAMPLFDGDEAGPDRFESSIEAVERLRRALRDEHSLLTQYKMIAWGRVFTPIQAALATVQSYPWTCDVPSIVNVVAASIGEPTATELLLQAQQ